MLHIAFHTDSRYTRFCGVAMVSLMRHNRGEAITFHILGDRLTKADTEALTILTENHSQRICFYPLEKATAQGLAAPLTADRCRCLLAELLPPSIDRVVCLDCDVLVLQPLKPLWDTDLKGKALAAVPQYGDTTAHCRRLGYPATDGYFNAGVLLVNLQYWRLHHVAKACTDLYGREPGRFSLCDSDLLNAVLHDVWTKVPLKWNVQEDYYRHTPATDTDAGRRRMATLTHPAILHFSGQKPWDYASQHPLRHLFYDYQQFTPWVGKHPLRCPWQALQRCVSLLPFSLGLRKSPYTTLPAEGVAGRP